MDSIAQKIEIDFTDDGITGSAGSVFLSRMSHHLGLPQLLDDALKLKVRNRGASDADMMLSLIYCLGQGDGALLDVDRLGADEPRQTLLGVEEVPGHRRLGEYLARFDEGSVERLLWVAHCVAKEVAPLMMEHELDERGYIPVFVDGSAIEVSGKYFEGSGVGEGGQRLLQQGGGELLS